MPQERYDRRTVTSPPALHLPGDRSSRSDSTAAAPDREVADRSLRSPCSGPRPVRAGERAVGPQDSTCSRASASRSVSAVDRASRLARPDVRHGLDVCAIAVDELAEPALVVPDGQLAPRPSAASGWPAAVPSSKAASAGPPHRARRASWRASCGRCGPTTRRTVGAARPRAARPRRGRAPRRRCRPTRAARRRDGTRHAMRARCCRAHPPARQLGRERQPLGERERVVHGEEAQDEDLRQPGPVAEPPRDLDRLARERVAPLAWGV